MPYSLDHIEYQQIIALDHESRLAHFIEKVADWEELWAVSDGEGWLVQAKGDQAYISLWPHPRFAEDIVKRFMPKNQSAEMDFEFLLEELIPTLKQENIHIAVFPNQQWEGLLLNPDDFERQLLEEMKKHD